MTEAIIHIGDGKCGSTSIQRSLTQAADALSAAGLSYIPDERTGNHFKLVTLIGRGIRGDVAAARNDAMRHLCTMRDAYRSVAPRFIILSAESFFQLPPSEVLAVLRRLEIEIGSVHIVGYVRPPVSMFLSLNQQKLKASHWIHRPDSYRRDIAAPFERWAEEKICRGATVGVFDPAALVGGSVVTDFAAILSRLTGRDVTLPDRRANVSMSGEQLVLLQRLRRDLFAHMDNQPAPASTRLVALFEAMNVAGVPMTKPRLNAQAASRVGANNAQFVERLRARYPDLAISAEAGGATDEPWPSNDIASVLETVDHDRVELLARLVPHYNDALRDGLPSESSDALARLDPAGVAVAAYLNYLVREGCAAAARDLAESPAESPAERGAAVG